MRSSPPLELLPHLLVPRETNKIMRHCRTWRVQQGLVRARADEALKLTTGVIFCRDSLMKKYEQRTDTRERLNLPSDGAHCDNVGVGTHEPMAKVGWNMPRGT